jgi:arylsulfatase A-like enzyme
MSETPGRNVLFVVMDTVRKDHLTPYGYDRPTTPGLEGFAEEARVYEQAVAPAPWTLPVHASMFTGLYPSGHRATQEDPYLSDDVRTLAESLSAAGYPTACYSSNAWITPYTRLTAGFDDQDNFFEVMPGEFLSGTLADAWQRINDNDRLRAVANRLVELGNTVHEHFAGSEDSDSKTPEVIDRTIEFVDAHEEFFAFVNLMDAHLPYYPPEEYAREFASGADADAVCQNSKEYNSGARDIDEAEWADIRGLYDAEIRHIDAELERLFDHLRETGRWADTTVIVCADHGELHGEHGLYGHEFCIYDPLVNVPLLVKDPELDPGREERQVELLDLYHTVLDVAGADGLGEPFDPKRSLRASTAEHRDFDAGEFAFVEYHRPVVELKQLESKANSAGITLDEDSRFYSRMRAARRPDAKFIRNERIADEGYRLDSDPEETTPVSPEEDDPVAEAASALADFEARVGGEWDEAGSDGDGDVLGDMSEDARQRLQDLGYME